MLALGILGLYYENKAKKRKEYEDWIYDRRQYLEIITRRFRDDCQALAEEAFTHYTNTLVWKSYLHKPDHMTYSFISNYSKSIKSLKSEYIDNFADKYSNGSEKIRVDALPPYLIDEYKKKIIDIADTFSDFGNIMRYKIEELKEDK